MIVLFTDFGANDIYVGQVKAALLAHLPAGAVIIDCSTACRISTYERAPIY